MNEHKKKHDWKHRAHGDRDRRHGGKLEKRGRGFEWDRGEREREGFLRVEDLSVEYTSGGSVVKAVNGVSFTLDRGKTLGLVGETGAGKTTIAKAIMRILPEPPARIRSGSIHLGPKNLLALPEHVMQNVRGNHVAMIFQDPMTALNPVMNVGSQIEEVVLRHFSCTKAEAAARAEAMLEMVGIPAERFVEYPHQFSGGMKQRVVIAMALACDPDLLLADEPTTALDVTIQAQVLEMINDLKSKLNTAMILITHDLGVVAETCDTVAIIYAGQIVEYGTREELFLNPAHPYTNGLFGAIPSMDEDDDSKMLHPIPGMPPDPTDLPEGCAFAPRCPYAEEACTRGTIENVSLGGTHLVRCLRFQGKEAEQA